MSDTTTKGIRIQVRSQYVADGSAPSEGRYFFAYKVRISNVGTETAQLVSRKWIITDAQGKIEVVDGAGVVGQQPVLDPGESFEYTSFCPLETPFGSIRLLPDGAPGRGALRSRDRAVPPRSAVGTELIVHGVRLKDRKIVISTSVDAERVQVVVADNGPGITMDLEDIWLPVQSGYANGTGFGLTIIRDSVTDLAGQSRCRGQE